MNEKLTEHGFKQEKFQSYLEEISEFILQRNYLMQCMTAEVKEASTISGNQKALQTIYSIVTNYWIPDLSNTTGFYRNLKQSFADSQNLMSSINSFSNDKTLVLKEKLKNVIDGSDNFDEDKTKQLQTETYQRVFMGDDELLLPFEATL